MNAHEEYYEILFVEFIILRIFYIFPLLPWNYYFIYIFRMIEW